MRLIWFLTYAEIGDDCTNPKLWILLILHDKYILGLDIQMNDIGGMEVCDPFDYIFGNFYFEFKRNYWWVEFEVLNFLYLFLILFDIREIIILQ